MYRCLNVGDRTIIVSGVLQGCVRTFPSCGKILASAIERCSKNRYKVCVIWVTNRAIIGYPCSSFSEAMDFLQTCYDQEIQLLK